MKKLCVESHPGGINRLCFVKGERELLTLQWARVKQAELGRWKPRGASQEKLEGMCCEQDRRFPQAQWEPGKERPAGVFAWLSLG